MMMIVVVVFVFVVYVAHNNNMFVICFLSCVSNLSELTYEAVLFC